jgi:ribosomal protein S18 acetylase RimI-like enzyme
VSSGSTTVHPVTPDDWELWRRLRLGALQDAPLAFGSSYELEADRTEADWRGRLARLPGKRFFAYVADEPAGIAGVYLRTEDRDTAPVPELISMWVHPAHRTSGVGRALVDEVVRWVAAQHFDEVRLMVAVENDEALGFYRALGFAETGYTQPLPHDASRVELEMARPITRTVSP